MSMPQHKPSSPICAIVCMRNELGYLPGLIKHLKNQGVDICFIDNGSDDGSAEYAKDHIGKGVLSVVDMPYKGYFSLADQLQQKALVEQQLTHSWILHLDADEIPHPATNKLTLCDIVRKADHMKCNVVNFEEFVFLPIQDPDQPPLSSHRDSLYYYHFAPIFHRLMRLYKRNQGLDNRAGAGHSIRGDVKIYPQDQVLRHYITLNQEHLYSKYIGREFDPNELKKGWHRNRIELTKDHLTLSNLDRKKFNKLPRANSRAFLRNRVRNRHFWQWPSAQD